MKIARLLHKENNTEQRYTYGLIKNNMVCTKSQIARSTGVPVPRRITDFMFDGWCEKINQIESQISFDVPLSKYTLLAPIPNPGKIICLAFNYKDHAMEQGRVAPKDTVIVIKPSTTLCGTKSDIACPDFVEKLDYEIELALIIGKRCKNVSIEKAKDYVFGYMICNDVSARDIQFKDKQFTRAKSFDTFAPCGPWVTTSDEIPDPHNLKMITKVNKEIRQDSTTSNMFIQIPDIISQLSKVMTLEAGDIISTGTPAGVALNNPGVEFLKDGDSIEMHIEGLGTIHNTVRMSSKDNN